MGRSTRRGWAKTSSTCLTQRISRPSTGQRENTPSVLLCLSSQLLRRGTKNRQGSVHCKDHYLHLKFTQCFIIILVVIIIIVGMDAVIAVLFVAIITSIFVGRGDALVKSITLNRRVVFSTPALAAT